MRTKYRRSHHPALQPEDYMLIRACAPTMTYRGTARFMGIDYWTVFDAALRMNLKAQRYAITLEPCPEEWIRIASEEARSAGLRPADVLSGRKDRKHVLPRWRALQRLRAEFPKASLAGMGRATGFDRTAISHGFKRLAQILPTPPLALSGE